MTPNQAATRIREADEALAAAGAGPFHLPIGELLPVVAGTVAAIDPQDWWVPGLRERAGAIVRDVPVQRLVDGFVGAKPYRVCPPATPGPLRALTAVGLAVADRSRTTVVHLGIGSASDGALHEALNLAALLAAPVVFVVAAHPLDGPAPLGPQLATTPAKLAKSFGIKASTVDGSDAKAVQRAVRAARKSGGPALIEAQLPGVGTEDA
ncbi:MAG: hypothetical protein KTR31_02030 [Myxococcales bacterium]|nr:hypothetical protein [Myxococcales bacterium]